MDMKRRDVLKGAAAATAAVAVGAPALLTPTPSYAQQLDAAKKWIDSEFQPSTLTKDQQMAEMDWFIKASQPFKGMKVSCASEILGIHEYESKTLTKAFAEITGIQVNHEMMDEGLIVDKIEVEIQSGKPIYDFWMNDSDFIGTHPRYNDIVGGSLTDFMAGDGKAITNPNLDLKDFIGLSFATFTDGKLYQLPDQQFANLYWFRYDWFQRPELKEGFKKQFGYDLGVPVNWSAYEDIAEFFTNTVKDDRRTAHLWPHGLRQEGSFAGLAVHRCVALDGRQRRPRLTQRASGRRMGHSCGGRHSARIVGHPRRRRQRPSGGLRADQIRRVAQEICATGSGWHGLPRGRRGAGSRPYRTADLLVQRFHGRTVKTRFASHEQGRHAEMAHGSEPAWRLLERRHEARLSGRGLLDLPQVCGTRANQGWLSLWPILCIENRNAEEVDYIPPCHPRKRHLGRRDDPTCTENRRFR